MRFIPGPDLPTGGKIVGLDGIRDAYETGRGIVPDARHRPDRDRSPPRRKGIVVTELPYGVGTERVIERIKSAGPGARSSRASPTSRTSPTARRACGWSSRSRTASYPEAILEQLYKQTPMEDSFGINAVALVDGQPRTLGLKEMLEVFLGHRFDVVRRRSAFRRAKAADRLHLVEGLLVAILDIDEVIQLIRVQRQRRAGHASG